MYGRVVAIALVAVFCVAAAPASSHSAKKKPAIKNVALRLDRTRAVSARLTATAGGTITATARNGTRLTLTIPADALPYDTTVTLTPVSKISGLTGKLAAGAQLGPEGLVLVRPATLKIAGARGAAIDWLGSGRDVLRTPAAKGGGLAISVFHFSGAAGYDGSVGGMPSLRASQQAVYKTALLPKMQAAQNSDAAFADALSLYLSWERAFEVIGDPSFMAAERANLKKLIKQAFLNQVNRAYESCKTKHDVGKELQNLRSYARQAEGGAALLLANAQDAKEIEDLANDRLEKCGKFQLDFETSLTYTYDVTRPSGEGTEHITASETLNVRVGSLPIQAVGSSVETTVPPPASAPLEVLEHTFTWERHVTYPRGNRIDCSGQLSDSTAAEPFTVQRLDVDAGDPPKIALELTRGEIIAHYSGQCTSTVPPPCEGPGCEPITTPFSGASAFPGYGGALYSLHPGELEGDEGLVIKDWSYLGGSVWARKTYSQSAAVPGLGGTVSEQTTFDLRHTPE